MHPAFASVAAHGRTALPGDMPAPPLSFDPAEITRRMESTLDFARRGFEAFVGRFRADPCYDAMSAQLHTRDGARLAADAVEAHLA